MGNCMPCLAHGSKSARSRNVEPIGGPCAQEAEWRRRLPRAACYSKRSVQYAKVDDQTTEKEKDKKEKDAAAPVRVKVVMSKKEAAQLLSLLAGKDRPPPESIASAGAGEMKIPREFMHAPRQDRCWRPALESIPEI